MTRKTVCLCMIVKDEAPVIRRCLASVRPIIDRWLIVDTGSSDATRDIVRAALADLPGDLVERPWVDFASNRNEALALARPRADYSLIIDADDTLDLGADPLPPLEADAYVVDIADVGISYQRTQLVRNALPWRYVGVLHEYLVCDGAGATAYLPLTMRRNHDGRRRRDPSTYRGDAAILERALTVETDPFLRSRYTFYLAQSWRDCGEREKALDAYLARAGLGYWDQEVFVSLLSAGRLMEALGRPLDDVVATYRRASEACPSRAEAAHAASRLCRLADQFARGYAIAKPAVELEAPPDGLFVERWIYDHGLRDEFAVNAYWSGHYRDCLDATMRALEIGGMSEAERPRFVANMRHAVDRLCETSTPAPVAWEPARPLGGTELMVEALRERLGADLEGIDLAINLYDPARRDDRPLVVWIHHDIDQAAVQWCRDPALVAGVRCFVFISYWQRNRFVAEFGLRPERCVVLAYAFEQGADARRWRPGPVLRCAYTSTPFRGLDLLLDAWGRVDPAETAELHVWSSMRLYAQDDGPYRALLDRARSMPGVVYHGLAPNKVLREALRTMHFLVYPNTFAETACLSVMEAMAAGCRVIVPAHGALPETTGGYARIYPWSADRETHVATFARVLADEFASPWRGDPSFALAQQAHCAAVWGWSRRLDEWRGLIAGLLEGAT